MDNDDIRDMYNAILKKLCVKQDSERENPFTAITMGTLVALSKVISFYVENGDRNGTLSIEEMDEYLSVTAIAIEAGELIFRAIDEENSKTLVSGIEEYLKDK
jgi:hypothetical protein